MKRWILALLITGLLGPGTSFAQSGQGGTESNLSLGFGARAFSMGRAFTALSDDPTAVFWNPAGLEYVYQQSATFFHTSLFEGANYDFLGYAFPTLNLGTFGVGVGRIGIGGIKQRDIFNTDQGSQFTSIDFIKMLKDAKIAISMDGKGRATDNICIERFWRSAKVEKIYLNEYDRVSVLKSDLADYMEFYNYRRFHETLNYKKPMDVYLESLKINNENYTKSNESVA
jgi:putative transposase